MNTQERRLSGETLYCVVKNLGNLMLDDGAGKAEAFAERRHSVRVANCGHEREGSVVLPA
jgi:hypothetical protein